MLALFHTVFGRSYSGWTRLTTNEGVKVLFPQKAHRACSVAETPVGPMNCVLYSGRWENSSANSILAIRDYQTDATLSAEGLFASWKADFQDAMHVTGVYKRILRENIVDGVHPRCDLLYTNEDETTFTRVSLIAQNNRLIVLFTVGMLQEVLAPACCESYRGIRL